jgi:phage gpG-like protein
MFTSSQAMNVIRPVIADQMQQFPVFMQISIAKFMKDQGSTGGSSSVATVFNTGDKLYKQKGTLFQSFIKNNANNVYKAKQSGNTFELEYGTKVKYSAIHEFGGKINSTPKSIRFALAMAIKTNWSPMWTAIYGAMKNKGFIIMKARPYFRPAIQDFKKNGQSKFEQQIKNAIVADLKDLQNRTRD